jgi:SAM-dependent methyltransferase
VPDTEYVLGHSRRERERLIRQADTFAAEASWLLEQAGVRPGGRVAEFGCGPLGIMNLLSERVADTGQIVGIDNDPRMIATAREVAGELGLRNVSLVVADAADTGLEPSSFDFAHARLLLIHSPHPERVAAEMFALVRPGGAVAVEELDWVSWVCQPPHPAWDRLRNALTEFACRRGLDVHIGRRLPELLRGAGLRQVSFRTICHTYSMGENDNHILLATFARQLGPALLADGLLAADEFDNLVDELESHLAKPETITIYSLLCQAWALKPVGERKYQTTRPQ